ncbi:MAG: elongation factor [Candidatus Midichloriaceae bacterium]|jgi:elongation factor P|nr:elongation factor [Candidatus Midichloriaceae bacterium]
MKIIANDIRVGNLLEHEGKLWVVLKTMHTQPGKGGAFMQVEMKDIRSGTKQNIRFRSSENVTRANLDQKTYQYLYENSGNLELMDKINYEQISLAKDLAGENFAFLQEGMDITVEFYGEEPISITLPELVTLEVEECEPVVKGQTATSSYKPAKLENGVRISVPQFINPGDKIVVRVETKEYMERAK